MRTRIRTYEGPKSEKSGIATCWPSQGVEQTFPRRNGRTSKYPFGQMNVGDELFVPALGAAEAARVYGDDNRKKFSRRQITNGYVVTRLA
jgi:hypothetical protein